MAGLLALAGFSAAMLVGQAIDPSPVHFAGMTIDRLGAALSLLVAAVGAATFRFSIRYLDGEEGLRRFLRRLAATVVAAYVFMLATNLPLLFAAWSLTSLGLHGLLTHYPDRPEARRPARKKFLISRLGDVALLAAILTAWRAGGTLDLNELLRDPRLLEGAGGTAVGLLVAVAALTKSAQFPFHSWLPETMEAPTPVSALMHAGVINAGGALLLRFAPLVARVPEALFLLALVGTLTATLGMLAMWAQVKVKRTLAWSTVGQMGFMMIQCGLGAFPAAALHIVGHGCYKAWSFLRSGDLPTAGGAAPPASPVRSLALALIGSVVSLPALAAASRATGYSPLHSPGESALAAFVALAIGQVWATLLRSPSRGIGRAGLRAATALGATFATAFGAFALYRGAELFLSPVLGPPPTSAGPLAWASAALPVAAFAGLVVFHAMLPALGRRPSGRALYVHALHGFYFGAIADRLVDRIWPSALERSVERA